MAYRVVLQKSAAKDLAALPKLVRERVAAALRKLAEEPRCHGVRKLVARDNEYRFRVGDYRIVFAIDDTEQLVDVLEVNDRKDAY